MTETLIVSADSEALVSQARELFLEYAKSLGFSLCFQDFDKEIANLPGYYAPPEGRLLLAQYQGGWAGCVGLRKLQGETCEMKRLYVRPQFRGQHIGEVLANKVIAEARLQGYRRMRLDTVAPVMKNAVGLYRQLGFYEIPPCTHNPQPGVLYMEMEL